MSIMSNAFKNAIPALKDVATQPQTRDMLVFGLAGCGSLFALSLIPTKESLSNSVYARRYYREYRQKALDEAKHEAAH